MIVITYKEEHWKPNTNHAFLGGNFQVAVERGKIIKIPRSSEMTPIPSTQSLEMSSKLIRHWKIPTLIKNLEP